MILQVLSTLFTPYHILLVVIGTPLGIIFGAIPGLSNTTGMALMLPLTFTMDAASAIIFQSSIYIGGISGGLISATLLGVPGAASNIATCFDAYPMAKSGRASRALGIGIFSSAIATLASIFIAMLLTAPLALVAVKLGPWEYFSLCTAAIVLVVTISKGEMFSGLISAGIGITLAMVGIAPVDGAKRFIFGTKTLLGGVPTLAVILGVFAIAILLESFANGEEVSGDLDTGTIKGVGIPLKEYFSYWREILKAFGIGLWIGFLPGLGAGLSNIVSYAMIKSGSKNPEKFGKGCDEGIIASEVANNASVGGAIIPTIALGIPGDSSCAILLSCLIMQGINAGPQLLKTNADLVYLFFGVLMFSTVVTFCMELFGIRTFPYILKTPMHYLYTAIFLLCMVGSYTESSSVNSMIIMVVMSVLGIFMLYGKLSFSPFILGFILGPMMEKYMRMGMTYSDEGFIVFLKRPVSCILLVIAALSLIWPFIRDARDAKRKASGQMSEVEAAEAAAEQFQVRDD